MANETIARKALAVMLIVAAAILGASVLDEIQYQKIDAEMDTAIDERFQQKSTKIGAWVMDREHVTAKIGIPQEELPSYQWAQQHGSEQQ